MRQKTANITNDNLFKNVSEDGQFRPLNMPWFLRDIIMTDQTRISLTANQVTPLIAPDCWLVGNALGSGCACLFICGRQKCRLPLWLMLEGYLYYFFPKCSIFFFFFKKELTDGGGSRARGVLGAVQAGQGIGGSLGDAHLKRRDSNKV